MKNTLFISISEYKLDESNIHLAKKFEGLSRYTNVFLIGRGKVSCRHMWRSVFYLISPRIMYVPLAVIWGSYLCFLKKIDTIICQGPLTEGLIGVVLKFIFRKELIVEIHGDWRQGPFLNRKRVFAPLFKKIMPFIANFSFARAEKIRGVAEYFLTDLRKKFPDKKYFVFPTFSDLDLFLSPSPAFGGGGRKNTPASQYICTAAVLSPVKNIETVIEAFSRVYKKFPELRLVIAGDGPSREKLQVTSCKLQVADRVVFTGRLSQEGVKNIMKDCVVFVLPSLSEGLPRVLLEAMALGKPVIATSVGGIPEIVDDGENGFLVEPKDVVALAQKIEYIILNPAAAQKMGEAGRIFVQKNFSNEKYIRNYINMIYL